MSDEYESAVRKTGWGVFHYFLISLCSLCTIAEASASLIIMIAGPLIACDFDYEKEHFITMHSTSSLGMAFGVFLFGTLSDINGRKESLPATMIIIFCGSMGLSFARTYFLINLAMFILGIGVAGNNLILRIYVIECLPIEKRGSCIALIDLVWIIGNLIFLGLFWSMIPSAIGMQFYNFRPNSWRVMTGLGAIPALLLASTISLLPSSPRYLLYRRKQEHALTVLRRIYAINFTEHTDKYPVHNLDECIQSDEDDYQENFSNGFKRIIDKYLLKPTKRIRRIFTPPLLQLTFLCTIASYLNFPGIIWLNLWATNILSQTSTESLIGKNNETCISEFESMALTFFSNCNQENNSYFQIFFITLISFVLGEIILLFIIQMIGKRLILLSSGLIGSTALITFIFSNRQIIKIVQCAVFLSTFAISYTTVTIMIMEVYPTALRGTIMGLTRILPHLVGYFMKIFMKLPCSTTLYISSGIMIGVTTASIFIPDLNNAPMQE